MKRMGVLGGISPQATMDFEARVHRISQQLIPQDFNRGYPPMVVWYHRRPPVRLDNDGRAFMPMEVDRELVEAAGWLGTIADFLVIPCNAAHVGLDAIQKAAGRPVLSMIEITADEVAKRGWRRAGVLGFAGAPRPHVEALGRRGIRCEGVDPAAQTPLDAGIRAVAEGRDGAADARAARTAVDLLRALPVDGVVLGCTEIPLLLGKDAEAKDLVSPAALLAEAAVRMAIGGDPGPGREC
jgi:aspartate racemase